MRYRVGTVIVAALAWWAAAGGTETMAADPVVDTGIAEAAQSAARIGAAGARHRPPPRPVLVVGDSLTIGTLDQGLADRMSAAGFALDGVVGDKGWSTKWGAIRLAVERDAVPATVIVEMGTNPWAAVPSFPSDVRVMVANLEARGAQRIVWITPVHGSGDGRYDPNAAVLADVAAEDSALVVADWRAVALAHPEWFKPDGIHYTDEGYAALASFMVDQLG